MSPKSLSPPKSSLLFLSPSNSFFLSSFHPHLFLSPKLFSHSPPPLLSSPISPSLSLSHRSLFSLLSVNLVTFQCRYIYITSLLRFQVRQRPRRKAWKLPNSTRPPNRYEEGEWTVLRTTMAPFRLPSLPPRTTPCTTTTTTSSRRGWAPARPTLPAGLARSPPVPLPTRTHPRRRRIPCFLRPSRAGITATSCGAWPPSTTMPILMSKLQIPSCWTKTCFYNEISFVAATSTQREMGSLHLWTPVSNRPPSPASCPPWRPHRTKKTNPTTRKLTSPCSIPSSASRAPRFSRPW